jgi:NTP pyrophosphatase (non-canonical NTP hydrolase)
MDFEEYQQRAQNTDCNPGSTGDAIVIPLLGLVGEAGTLLSEYKKLLRDGGAHERFKDQVAEELGDVLWYIANLASKFGLDLGSIAESNLTKTTGRWLPPADGSSVLDDQFPSGEQLPRQFEYELRHEVVDGVDKLVVRDATGAAVGDPLTDNSHRDDGYRFHDVLHLAFAAKLGWSPVLRKLLGRKRKSDRATDNIEDGARAAAIEEMIAAVVGEYALRHGFLASARRVDWELLRVAKRLTAGLSVRVRSEAEWEDAIVTGVRVWGQLRKAGGGTVRGNLLTRELLLV